jgi:serine/threonine protein kinase
MQEHTTDLVGQTLGNCTLERLIGKGGMGTVYLARQQRPQRYVAIKILQPNLADRDTEHTRQFLARFRREADIIAKLEHANIIPIYEYGEQNGLAFLVMPYLSGGSLCDLMAQRGTLSLTEVVSYLDQAASALDYAHAQGVIHRDLKPANFLLHSDGRLILTDFGIARIAEESAPSHTLTQTGLLLGTPDYMAPEMATGESVDYRADIYELGIVIFTLLSGHVPFNGPTPIAALTRRLREPLPLLHDLKPEIPSSVDEVLQKATAIRREDRYTSLQAMSRDMHTAIKETIIARMIPPAINQEQIPTVLRTPDVTTTPRRPVQTPEQPAYRSSPISLAHTTIPQSLASLNTPTPLTTNAIAHQNPSIARKRAFWWPLALLCVILLISGSIFAGIQIARHDTGSQTRGHNSPTQTATNNTQMSTTTTPTIGTTATSTTQHTTSSSILPAGTLLYSASKPGVNCDNGGGTWITYNSAQVACEGNTTNITNTAQSSILQGIFLTTIPGQSYPADYVVTAQLQPTTNSNGDFGLYFRNQPGNLLGVYSFLLHTDGSWTVSVYDNVSGAPKELARGQLDNTANGVKLAVVAKGSQFTFYANDSKLSRINDTTYTQGTAGIVVNEGSSINVSNFSLYATN